jgi:hypothetical protein
MPHVEETNGKTKAGATVEDKRSVGVEVDGTINY